MAELYRALASIANNTKKLKSFNSNVEGAEYVPTKGAQADKEV